MPVGVLEVKPIDVCSPNFWDIFTSTGCSADCGFDENPVNTVAMAMLLIKTFWLGFLPVTADYFVFSQLFPTIRGFILNREYYKRFYCI